MKPSNKVAPVPSWTTTTESSHHGPQMAGGLQQDAQYTAMSDNAILGLGIIIGACVTTAIFLLATFDWSSVCR
jgi:hypothetical protein